MIRLVKNSVLVALVLLGQVSFGSEGPVSERLKSAYPSIFGAASKPDIVDMRDFSAENMVSLGSGSTPAPVVKTSSTVVPMSFSSLKERFPSLGSLKKPSYSSDSAKKAACVAAGAAALYVGYRVVKSYCKQSCEINELGDFLKKHSISTIYETNSIKFYENDFYWFKWLLYGGTYESPYNLLVNSQEGLMSLIEADIRSKKAYLFSNYDPREVQTSVTSQNIFKAIELEKSMLFSNLEKLAPMISNGYDQASWFSRPKSLFFSNEPKKINESLIQDILTKWRIGFDQEKSNSSWFGSWSLFRSSYVQKTSADHVTSSVSQSSQNKQFIENLSDLSKQDIINLKKYFVDKYGSYLNNAAAVYFDTLIAWAYLKAMQDVLSENDLDSLQARFAALKAK